jgi:F0F1-type ATP synthase delta subunit
MQNDYAQAFLAHVATGASFDESLAGLVAVLQRRNHTKLLPSILRLVLRTLEAVKGVSTASVRVATATMSDADKAKLTAALKALGVTEHTAVETVVDETLIGGFIAIFNHHEQDHSYKRTLTNLYESITA